MVLLPWYFFLREGLVETIVKRRIGVFVQIIQLKYIQLNQIQLTNSTYKPSNSRQLNHCSPQKVEVDSNREELRKQIGAAIQVHDEMREDYCKIINHAR